MRTTLDIEDDVLAAAKELARQQGHSAGHVVSTLLRRALTGDFAPTAASSRRIVKTGGFRPFAASGRVVTNELIDTLRDHDGV